jgi:uncharacterized protein (DUF1499 family)
VIVLALILTTGCGASGFTPNGIVDGRLAPCPSSPNCVSSQMESSKKYIAPLRYNGNAKDARDRLVNVIKSMNNSDVKTVSDLYIHAVFRSAVFKFADDVEFQIIPEENRIHVRSASRTGYYDFGVNRSRVEEIRKRFNAKD